jgi:histidinol-phosphate/aromatic aminotransferase/cobyric acid decarboxylase-like protein
MDTSNRRSSLAAPLSRRQFGRISGILGAAAAPFFSEFAMAQEAERRTARRTGRALGADVIRISSNENPMGPCVEGIEAMSKIAPHGWRYSPFGELDEMVKTIAEIEGVKADHVLPYPGSSAPLMRATCAFTSPERSWTMGDPGYSGGAPEFIGSKTVRVPLRADFSHDVEAMIKTDPNAGAYYVCNPNNPSGTVTARKDIEYLLANKKKDAVVVVDEAYIHYSPTAQPASDLVAAGKDVVVLRTFSKIYGMAGIRAGFAMGRPDLLAKMRAYGTERTPVTASACAMASLKSKNLIAERRALNASIREETFEFLQKKGAVFVPSETNFFMVEVKRPGRDFADAMAKNGVVIGRVWDAWPTKVRVTVGTRGEMKKFQEAFEKVYHAA